MSAGAHGLPEAQGPSEAHSAEPRSPVEAEVASGGRGEDPAEGEHGGEGSDHDAAGMAAGDVAPTLDSEVGALLARRRELKKEAAKVKKDLKTAKQKRARLLKNAKTLSEADILVLLQQKRAAPQ